VPLRKSIVFIGSIILIAAVAMLVYPEEKADSKVVYVSTWDLQSETLAPGNGTFYGRLMTVGMWFELNVSSSGLIELQISISQSSGTKVPFFTPSPSTSFTQQVSTGQTGTYVIDVTNISPSTVTLDGNVITKKWETTYHTVQPYAFAGFLLMLAGAAVLVLGIKRSRKQSTLKRKT
jgi:hypothetical protein